MKTLLLLSLIGFSSSALAYTQVSASRDEGDYTILYTSSASEPVCDCYGFTADGHPDFLGRLGETECRQSGGEPSGRCE